MKDKKQIESVSDSELIELFNQTSSTQEKLQYFSKIQDYNCQMELLNSIPDNERYNFIGKIKSSNGISLALNSLGDDKTKSKTFNFIAKQFKGNNLKVLEILTQIDFDVTIPPNVLTFQLNNINALNLDFLLNIQKHICRKFSVSEEDELIRDFEFENDTYIDPVKQIEHKKELEYEEMEW